MEYATCRQVVITECYQIYKLNKYEAIYETKPVLK